MTTDNRIELPLIGPDETLPFPLKNSRVLGAQLQREADQLVVDDLVSMLADAEARLATALDHLDAAKTRERRLAEWGQAQL